MNPDMYLIGLVALLVFLVALVFIRLMVRQERRLKELLVRVKELHDTYELERREDRELLEASKSRLVKDFAMGASVPERITIEVLKQIARENPQNISFAIQENFRRAAIVLQLLGEETAKLVVPHLNEAERAVLCKGSMNPSPVSLEGQIFVLKDFTELVLQANASLRGSAEYAESVFKGIVTAGAPEAQAAST